MRLLKIVLAVGVLAGLAMAEEKVPARFVRVVGTAEVKVVPDRAVIEVGVEKQDPSASVAKHAEDAAARRILAALKTGGIDEKDIQTTYLSLQPQSSYVKKVRVSYLLRNRRSRSRSVTYPNWMAFWKPWSKRAETGLTRLRTRPVICASIAIRRVILP